jgi:hypothetical protein
VSSRKKGVAARPWVKAKNLLQRRLLLETFQSFDEVGNALSLAGMKEAWKCITTELSPPVTAEAVKKRLTSIVYRRNQIVHEGDIARTQRPRRLKYNALTHAAIKADVEWIRDLVETIDDVLYKQRSATAGSLRRVHDAQPIVDED